MTNPNGHPNASFFAHIEGEREQLLRDHLLGVSAAARRHADKIGLGTAGGMVGLLHDFGKYSHTFQQYLRRMTLREDSDEPDSERGKIDHSTAGAQAIWQNLKARGAVEGIAGEILAICIASHHSGLIDCITPGGSDGLTRRMKKADSESHYEEVCASAEEAILECQARYLEDPNLVGSLREAIAKICRGTANETIVRFKIGLLVRFLFSCLIDADRTDTADFSSGTAAALRQHARYVDWGVLAALLERRLESFPIETTIDRLRKQVSDACLSASERPAGIYLLTVPTALTPPSSTRTPTLSGRSWSPMALSSRVWFLSITRISRL
jgi:CRISPR-associated endonuclease/helicase Cas3